ncbi:MAG TPA: glycosyltransferase, partial [Candidatus Paceibacterota bacterium]
MKILIFTQKVDKTDPVLGFFHSWIVEFSKQFDSVEVVCLEKGKFDLPINVNVYSLGKPQYQSEARYGAGKFFQKIKYILNLYKYLFLISGSYDRVFVHMNEEYVLLCGLYWKIKGTPVYFWRNHSKGSIWTHIAVILSSKVFCTSSDSFTARFKKTSIMPAGIDTTIFKPLEGIVRKKYSICMVGRISPVKHIDLGLEAFQALVSSGTQASLAIIGPTFPNDKEYLEGLKKYVEDKNLS